MHHTNIQNYLYIPNFEIFFKYLLKILRQMNLNLFLKKKKSQKTNREALKFMSQTEDLIFLQMSSFTWGLWLLKADWLLRLTSQLIRLWKRLDEVITAIGGPHYPRITGTGNAFLNGCAYYSTFSRLYRWLLENHALQSSRPCAAQSQNEPELARDWLTNSVCQEWRWVVWEPNLYK